MSLYLWVAEHLFEKYRYPMRPRDMINLAREEGLLPDFLIGKAPHHTIGAKLSVHIRKYGPSSKFVRTAPGLFYLRRLLDKSQSTYEAIKIQPPLSKEKALVFPASWLDIQEVRFQGVR